MCEVELVQDEHLWLTFKKKKKKKKKIDRSTK